MPEMQPVRDSILNQVKNAYRNHPVQTVAVGIGVVILAPAVLPLVKPLAKAAIKSGFTLYEKTKGAIAETGEVIGDIVAEAKAEALAEEANKATGAASFMITPNTMGDTQDN
ncbi:MAG: DUF5132 domain-containing protein [Calothrix sp. MO_192.B10]|nr:DUF5132 domain-containing protein [Calothrix sp. MO_192.B10]